MIVKSHPRPHLLAIGVLFLVSLMLGISFNSALRLTGGRPLIPRIRGVQSRYGRTGSSLASSMTSTEVSAKFDAVMHPKYEHLESFHIAEYGLHGALYKHTKSGAQVLPFFFRVIFRCKMIILL